jgi:hypothetical protein
MCSGETESTSKMKRQGAMPWVGKPVARGGAVVLELRWWSAEVLGSVMKESFGVVKHW